MNELTEGDAEKIFEVREWLKNGMSPAEAEKKLVEIGYNNYHLNFILEEATGKKFLPEKPIIDVMPEFWKSVTKIFLFAFVIAVLAWLYFRGWEIW